MSNRYIALEGIEGAGKSTLARRLVTRLEAGGYEATLVREPGGTTTGERIRDVLLDPDAVIQPWTETLLFAAARAQLVRDVVEPALAAGSWVVSDRSVYSSLAYQGAGRGLGIDLVRLVNDAGLGGRWPDLVVLLRLEPAAGLERQEIADRIGAEGVTFQRRVSEAFDTLAAADADRFVVVDATRPVDEIIEEIWDRLHRQRHRS
ncbi:MAG: dTMP kinase, partial [Acidimicrobiia bacterium]